MRESYVRPPLLGREAPSATWALWRFRAVAFLLLAVLVVLTYLLYQQLTGAASSEDPGVGALPAPPGSVSAPA